MKVYVSYKKITVPIGPFFASDNKLFIVVNSKLWVIDCSGRQYPDIDLQKLKVAEIRYRRKTIFAKTDGKEVFICKLGKSVFSKIPIDFDLVKFGKHILFSKRNSLYALKDPEKGIFDRVHTFEKSIADFACTSRQIFILVGPKVYWSFWNPKRLQEGIFVQPVDFLVNFMCKKLHVNCLSIFFAENTEYLICILKNKPILITKPDFYYNVSFMKYQVVFLAEKLLIFSIFTGKIEKSVSLTGFSSVYDIQTGKLWVYANFLFEISVIISRSKISRCLMDQQMFRRAIAVDKSRLDILEEYVRYLFRKKSFKRALKYFSMLEKAFYFDKVKVLRNASRAEVFMISFYSDISKDIAIPGRIFIKFLIERAFLVGEHLELVSKILFSRKKFLSFIRIIKRHRTKKLKFPFIERLDQEACSPEERQAIHRYNLYFNTKYLISQSITMKRFKEAKKDLVKAYKEKVLNKETLESAEPLIHRIRSKSITYIFTAFLGNRCLEIMHQYQAYTNLPYYIRFSQKVVEDLQIILKLVNTLPKKVEEQTFCELKKRLYSTGILETFLETVDFVSRMK